MPFDVVAEDDLLPKPAYLAPCNGCGACCLMAQCSLSLNLFGKVAAPNVCPALERTGERTFGCGLMTRPADFMQISERGAAAFAGAAAVILGAGNGCDAPTDAEWSALGRTELLRRARASWDAAGPDVRRMLSVIGAVRPPE